MAEINRLTGEYDDGPIVCGVHEISLEDENGTYTGFCPRCEAELETNGDPIKLAFTGCARCGGEGHELVFMPFTFPIFTEDHKLLFSHWAMCPKTDEPIMLWIGETDA